LKYEEKRYQIFTSILSKKGIDCEQLFKAGNEMLQGKQIWNLKLKSDQFKTWSRLYKSLMSESHSGLSLLTSDQVDSLNFWMQEEICYGTGMVLLKMFLNVNPKNQFVDLKEEDIMAEIERLDLLQLI
jgi:hypothetical protein